MIVDDNQRIPTYLWVESKIRELNNRGIGAYLLHRGEKMDGIVLVQTFDQGVYNLYRQQCHIDGTVKWVQAISDDANIFAMNDYIAKQTDHDPDLWIIEIESSIDVI